jgi:hypothetical protein
LEDLLHWNLEDVRDVEGDFDQRRVAYSLAYREDPPDVRADGVINISADRGRKA